MGFFEILIIAVVTLLAVGPERMPEAVRAVALTIGRIKRAFQSAKSEIEEHIGADDIRRQLRNEQIMADIEDPPKLTESRLNEKTEIHEDQQTLNSPPPVTSAATDSNKSYTADS